MHPLDNGWLGPMLAAFAVLGIGLSVGGAFAGAWAARTSRSGWAVPVVLGSFVGMGVTASMCVLLGATILAPVYLLSPLVGAGASFLIAKTLATRRSPGP